MGRLVEGIPNVKFLITGRPEPRIQPGFRLGFLKPLTDIFVLHGVEPSTINANIRLFLEHGLSELAERRGIERGVWPTDQDLDLLCERAGGLFVYAVATLKSWITRLPRPARDSTSSRGPRGAPLMKEEQ